MTFRSHARITAAVIAPLALLAAGCGGSGEASTDASDRASTASSDPTPPSGEPSATKSKTESGSDNADVDYLLDGAWHQADGDVVELPKHPHAYDAAVVWDDRLVATRWDGEVFSVADVIDVDGKVVDTFETTSGVVVNEAGTTIAWIDTDGVVMTAWDDDEVSVGTVDLAAPGESVAYFPAAITGGPSCHEDEDGCVVHVNSGLGDESRSFSSHGVTDIVGQGVTKVFDATATGAVSVINKVTEDLDTCGGLLDLDDGTRRWTTCDFQVQQISPDGGYVAAPQSQYDGLGPTRLSILDATSGQPVADPFERDGWFVGSWAWSHDGALLFTAHDGSAWHLMSMATDGTVTDVGDPVRGNDVDNPYVLIQH
ncbi:hypothetical protein [Nocardioides bizhenqiangii]|uniref:WD40 repeat domain-containing protein n=1 Tax=Nocardioides bizhenqiangii TaxID=3095076 RepID=A0ABZ0ZN56_9ACTN|nr:hypothetical protein [Nocardioides sp. HM61]WQQ25749.1 hypothetical protein SHK19_17500 [Nocardioides sp. HM61]